MRPGSRRCIGSGKATRGDLRFALFSASLVSVLWLPLAWRFGRGVAGPWGLVEWGVIAASALVHVGDFVTLLRGYRAADLTVVYPVARAAATLISALCAPLLLALVRGAA